MTIKVSNEIDQVVSAIDHLNVVKDTLETGKPELLLNLYSEMQNKNVHLSHYFSDNRGLLKGLTDYLNGVVEGTNISFTMSPMHTNSFRLNILHFKKNIGELNLSNKNMHLYSHLFHFGLQNQTNIEQLEEQIVTEQETIERFELDMMKYRHYSPIKRKLKGLSKLKIEQMEEYLEKRKNDHQASMVELKANNESLYDWWNDTLLKFQDYKVFIKNMERLSFSHNFKGLLREKFYYMHYRKETNHSHSSFLSYENKHISILSADEWEQDDITSSNLSRFKFTSEEFDFLCDQILNEPQLPDVSREHVAGVDCIIVFFDLGKIAISKNGLIVSNGEEVNLFFLIRFPAIRKALCLTYKERSNEENLKSLIDS